MGADSYGRLDWLELTLVLSFLVVPFSVTAQITFERTYGGSQLDAGRSVQQTSDGGYIVAGQTESFGAGLFDVYLIKTDSLGNVLWSGVKGGSSQDWGFSVQQTLDGGYIIAGVTLSRPFGPWDVYLVRSDSLGNTLWEMTYGGSEDDWANCVQQTSDGGYVLVGDTECWGAGSADVYLVKTDSSGNTEWATTYGGSLYDAGMYVEGTSDGGYIIVGRTASFGAGGDDVYLIKTDALGDVQWDTTYGGSLDDGGCCVRQAADGGYIISGQVSFLPGGNDAYLIKTDSLGGIQWDTRFGGNSADCGYSVEETFDGGYIVAGWTNSFGAGQSDVYLIRVDSAGGLLWELTYGDTCDDWGNSVHQTSDSGFIVTGYTSSFGAGEDDVYLIKTDKDGLIGIYEGSPGLQNRVSYARLLQNSPNPFHYSTAISYSLPAAAQVTLTIYDITGRLVETLVNETQQPGTHQVRWKREGNSSGVYFYRLRAAEFVETRKMVVVE